MGNVFLLTENLKFELEIIRKLLNVRIAGMLRDGNYDFLNFPTSSIKSVWPMKTERQQYRSRPNSSRIFFAGSPSAVRLLNSSQR